MIVWFGLIPLGIDHLTGPTEDQEAMRNTWAEHAVTRGKPVLQEIGAELDTRSFSFFFDEGFCNPGIQYGLLRVAFQTKTPAPLVIPGAGYRGQIYVVESLRVTTQATSRTGRLVRLDASIELKEAPRPAGTFAAIGAAVSLGAASAGVSLAPGLRQ